VMLLVYGPQWVRLSRTSGLQYCFDYRSIQIPSCSYGRDIWKAWNIFVPPGSLWIIVERKRCEPAVAIFRAVIRAVFSSRLSNATNNLTFSYVCTQWFTPDLRRLELCPSSNQSGLCPLLESNPSSPLKLLRVQKMCIMLTKLAVLKWETIKEEETWRAWWKTIQD